MLPLPGSTVVTYPPRPASNNQFIPNIFKEEA